MATLVRYQVSGIHYRPERVLKESGRPEDAGAEAPEIEKRNLQKRIGHDRAIYSNRGWREKNFENVVFEPVWRGKLFQMKVFGAAIDSDKCSSTSELSARFVGRLKFSVLFEHPVNLSAGEEEERSSKKHYVELCILKR